MSRLQLKPCIVLLTTGLALAGAETQLVQLAVRLKGRGWDVKVVSMLKPLAYVEVLKSARIPVESLYMAKGIPDVRALFKLTQLMRQWSPQILHSHMVHANLLGRISRLFYKVPVQVSTAHSVNEGARWRELAYRYTDFLCDLTTNVSAAAVKRYVGVGAVPPKKIRLVPNGVDTSKFSPNPLSRIRIRNELGIDQCFVWIAVGRFTEAKDYPTLISAFARLIGGGAKVKLLLVGSGNLESSVRALVKENNLSTEVLFLGVRNDIADLMNAADAYVMSSSWEGLPMVLLEAASSGLPVVATEVGGNPEIIRPGINGLLVPPSSSVALADAMNNIMNLSIEDRLQLGSAARDWVVKHYDLEHIVDCWESIYFELLSKPA